jgi:hypothetical protein
MRSLEHFQDLQLDRLWVVYPGDHEYKLDHKIAVIPANSLPDLLERVHKGVQTCRF